MTAELVVRRAPSVTVPALASSMHWRCTDNGHTSYDRGSSAAVEVLVPLEPGDLREPVRLAATSVEQGAAALFTATLWNCVELAGGPRPPDQAYASFPGAFTPEWVAVLELPTREHMADGQAVALADDGFARHPGRVGLLVDYRERPRTWVFERAQESVVWLNLAASYLTKLSASRFPVGAAVYDSHTADRPSAAHWDQWYSAVVQVEGAKVWRIGPDEREVVTRPGDVLLLPEGVSHAVGTPADPGFSRHLAFALAVHTVYARVS